MMSRNLVALCSLTVMLSAYADGACNNAEDLKTYSILKSNLSAIQKTCIIQGAPGAEWYDHCIKGFFNSTNDGERCMSNCVHLRANLSTGCSSCFGQISGCVFKNCVSKCLDATSPGCIECGKQYCDADFLKCSGLPSLPPPVAVSSQTVAVTKGACDNAKDLKIYDAEKNSLSAIQKTCITQGAPGAQWYDHCIKHFMNSSAAGEQCMGNCVHLRANLSTGCSSCFGQISACVFKNCVMKCLDATSTGCIECGKQFCDADFLKCSGLPDLPPPSLQALEASSTIV